MSVETTAANLINFSDYTIFLAKNKTNQNKTKQKNEKEYQGPWFSAWMICLFCVTYDRSHCNIDRRGTQKQRVWRIEKIFWEKPCYTKFFVSFMLTVV